VLGLVVGLTVPVSAASSLEASSVMNPASTNQILGVQKTISSSNGPDDSRYVQPPELLYHGGPVEHTNKNYAIYWVPSDYTVSSKYTSLINQFFTDVAKVSGVTSNVYYDSTQYKDTTGAAQYKSTFAGSVVDTNALPVSGCSDAPYTSVGLTDAQIQTEIQYVIKAQKWTANSSTEFFMFTAKGIGSCFDRSSSACSFSMYCAYHSWIGGGTTATLYSNMPYAATANCDVGQHPNHDDADATINVTSHEHMETITDQQGNAYWDIYGNEIGDKCAWNFGTLSGTNGAKYNETINGHNYSLQQEWSNKSGKWVQKGT
jgi:hypothetical protein